MLNLLPQAVIHLPKKPLSLQRMKRFFEHLGRLTLMVKEGFARPENIKVYWKEFMEQCNDIGIRSLPIVLIISLFLGMVLTIQLSYQLVSPLVPKTVIAGLVRDSSILELCPTVVCIVLAGVVGSKNSIRARQYARKRADRRAGDNGHINTKSYLVLPKIIASNT